MPALATVRESRDLFYTHRPTKRHLSEPGFRHWLTGFVSSRTGRLQEIRVYGTGRIGLGEHVLSLAKKRRARVQQLQTSLQLFKVVRHVRGRAGTLRPFDDDAPRRYPDDLAHQTNRPRMQVILRDVPNLIANLKRQSARALDWGSPRRSPVNVGVDLHSWASILEPDLRRSDLPGLGQKRKRGRNR